MRTRSVVLAKALQSARPLVIVFYEEPSSREQLIEDIQLLAPGGMEVRRTSRIEDAFTAEPMLLLLTPEDERRAVELLEGGRELMRGRTVPAVLFLLRGGEAERALAELPALASWTRGMLIDPERVGEVDVAAEREHFQQEAGCSPEEWLADFRAGRIPDTTENLLRSHRALLLERPT
jgi:hypothetical protein